MVAIRLTGRDLKNWSAIRKIRTTDTVSTRAKTTFAGQTALGWHRVNAARKNGRPGARKNGSELRSGYVPVEHRLWAADR